jgi:hypothetical protein
MLNVVILSVIMLNVIMLNGIMLIMLNVIMLSDILKVSFFNLAKLFHLIAFRSFSFKLKQSGFEVDRHI